MEQKTVNISILQMSSVVGDINANINKVKTIVDKYLEDELDVLVLPEVWSCGWSCSDFKNCAQEINKSSVIDCLSEIAYQYNINVIGGSFIEKRNDLYYNTTPVFDRGGNLVATYSKNHLYSYYGCDEGKYITVGDSPVMVELDGVNYGLTVCYDIRFPEIYRAYSKAGADVLINCAAWGKNKPIPWEMMTKSRAIENQCFMVAVDQCGKIIGNNYNLGHSRIINYKGEELALIEEDEIIVNANLNLSEMYDFRNKCKVFDDIRDNYEVKILCKR